MSHTSVLLHAYIEGLNIQADGCYVDATFGRGGHARQVLQHLGPKGRLLALDRDPEAIDEGLRLAQQDPRFQISHRPFSELAAALEEQQWQQVDGIGFDLGVSSPQLDQAERGFSLRHEGPLDMRMNPESEPSLADKLRRITHPKLAKILRDYGDERYASRIATAILKARDSDKLHTTKDLENCCFHAVPKQKRYDGSHPATRSFQALRIWVNDEYHELESALISAMQCLKPQGRLAVISFHSGEDRRTRDLIETQVHPCICPPQWPLCTCGRVPSMRWIQKKPLRASETEIEHNPRSRSALLRIAEHL